jgi:hypothetical protein
MREREKIERHRERLSQSKIEYASKIFGIKVVLYDFG